MEKVLHSQSKETDDLLSTAVHRQVRALSYPEDSEMGLFFALAIPLDDTMSTKSISVAFFFEANYELPTSIVKMANETDNESRIKRSTKSLSLNRTMVYIMLESKFESLGFPGKQCLLRTICETTRLPLYENNGLLGDIINIIFKPSSSIDENLPIEYIQAEEVDSEDDCATIYANCPFAIYDYITMLDV